MVHQIEALGRQLQRPTLAEPETPRYVHIESPEGRTDTGVSSREGGAVSGGVAVAIQIGSNQQVEGARTVGAEDGREQEVSVDRIPPRFQDAVEDYFVPLIECAERFLRAKVGLIVSLEIAVVIEHVVDRSAERVVSVEADVAAEALAGLENQRVVVGLPGGLVQILLQQ